MIRPLRGDGDLLAFEEGGMPSPRQVLILDFRMINLNTAKATSTDLAGVKVALMPARRGATSQSSRFGLPAFGVG